MCLLTQSFQFWDPPGSKKPSVWTDVCQCCYWRALKESWLGQLWNESSEDTGPRPDLGDVKIHVWASQRGGVEVFDSESGRERPSWEGCGCGHPQVVPSFCIPTSTCWGSQVLHKLISPWFLSIFYILGLLIVKTTVIFQCGFNLHFAD